MIAEQHLKDGDLNESLRTLQDQVRDEPSTVKHRIFLFQLLAVLGQWKRANTQLDVIKGLDVSAWPMVQTYREAIRCEMLRAEIFGGQRSPLIFGEPQRSIALMIEALRQSATGEYAGAQKLRAEAFELAETASGSIDGDRFEWIADADSRLGPLLEIIVNGSYYWIPFHRIIEIRMEAPEDLRDLLWIPAQFTWANGGECFGLIPARYPGSQDYDNSNLQLGRRTEWLERGTSNYEGVGQRVLVTDSQEYSLLEIRHISFLAEQE